MTEAISKRTKYLLPSNESSHIKEPMIMYIFNNSSQVSRLILKNSLHCCQCILVVQKENQFNDVLEGDKKTKTNSFQPENPNLS